MLQFDIVQIKTTKRIRFMSGPEGHVPSPHGNWSIVGFIESDAMIAKDSTIVRVPIEDLRQVISLDPSSVIDKISRAGLASIRKLSTIEHIAKVFDIDVAKAKLLLQADNLPLEVESQPELDQVTEWLRRTNHGKKRESR